MVVRKLLLFLILFFLLFGESESKGFEGLKSFDSEFIIGEINVCYNSLTRYRTSLEPSSANACDYYYIWEVKGGVFASGDTSIIEQGREYVDVTWLKGEDQYKLEVTATYKILPPNPDMTCNFESSFEEKGFLNPNFTGDANELPPLSTWEFNGNSETESLICSDDGTISAVENNPASEFNIETRLYYENAQGEVTIIKDWSSIILIDGYTFTPNYIDLHAGIKLFKQSRYVNCPSIAATEEFTIDFYLIPDFNLIHSSQPQCAGEIATATFSLSNAYLSSVIIGLTTPSDEFISFQIEAENDSVFTISDTLSYEVYDPTSEKFVNQEIDLGAGNYEITMEPLILKDSASINYPCFVNDTFTINEPPNDYISLNIQSDTIELDCQNDLTTINFQLQREDSVGAKFDYILFDSNNIAQDTIGYISDAVSFQVGLGNYYIKGKETDCSWDNSEAVLVSDTVNIVSHSISFEYGPVANELDGYDYNIFCIGDSTASISVTAQDALSGSLDYLLKKENDGSWNDYDTLINESSNNQVEFQNLPEGDYKLRVKFTDCADWTVRDNEVIESSIIQISTPDSAITVSDSVSMNRPTCAGGSDGFFTFYASGGTGSSYSIIDAVISNNPDGQNNSFSDMTINNLSAGVVVDSITVEDSAGCSVKIDIVDQTMLSAIDPFQFTSQTTTQPQCYDSDGIFEFSYTNANVADSLINKYVVIAGDSCIDNNDCDSNDDISVFSPEINLDRTNNSLTVSATEIANNTSEYQVYLNDDQCVIVSDIISFTEKSQPSFSSDLSYQISCKGDSRNINLSMSNNQGSFIDFDLELERKPSGDSIFTLADMDTVSILENVSGVLTIENLYEGEYKIYGTDGFGCTFVEHEFELVEPDTALTINARSDTLFTDNAGEVYHISEYGANDGHISFSASGGEESYSFMLYANQNKVDSSTNSTSGTFSNLFANDANGNLIEYYVRVVDDRSCLVNSDTLTLNEPDSLSFQFSLNEYEDSNGNIYNIKCNDGTDTLRVETEGGVYPHLVEVYKGNINEKADTLNSQLEVAVFSGLSQGSYRIKVTDKFDTAIVSSLRTVIDIDSIELVEPDSLSVTTNVTQPICYGDSTGSITVDPSGGASFADNKYYITFLNDTGGVVLDSIASELTLQNYAGNYYYKVVDEFGCEYRSGDYKVNGNPISITELSPRLSVVEDSVTYPPCAGDETATLSVHASGGRSGGSYTLELYDKNGPSSLIDSVSTENSEYHQFQNLFAGDYRVVVYDDSLCSDFVEITIEERDAPLEFISIESILSKCANSSDAKLKITSAGGDSPHLFSLDNINFHPIDSTTTSNDGTVTYHHKTFTGLVGDSTYTIYLKDDNYYDSSYNNVCLITTTKNIPKTPSLALSIEKTDVLCFGEESGEFTLTPSYGNNDNINDFNIEINGPNGTINHDQGYVDSLSAGSYEVEITLKDTTACQTPLFDRIDIDQPEPLTVEISSATDYNCSTIEDIILSGAIGGGLSTDKYLYAINSDNSADFDSLEISKGEFRIKRTLDPGWNTFYLKSSYNCLASDSFFIESVVPNIQVLSNHSASCNDRSDGEIEVTSSFEKLDFKLMNLKDTFSISDEDTVIFEGLEAGIYQLTGSSSSCLADTLEIIINQPDSIVIQPEIIEMPSCNQANGLGGVKITGGTLPYQVFWQLENGNILDSTSLKSGYYDIIIEDANNCSAMFPSFFVGETNDFTVSIQNSSNPTCGENNGSILIQTHEGVPPYDINWFKDGSLLLNDTDSLTELSEGSYIFSVTDAMGCFFEDSVELNSIEPINVELSNEIAADCDTQNGSITLSVTGGTPPYSYSWPDSIPYTDRNYAEGLWGAKIYTVRVSDANLCTTNHEFVIGNIGAPEVAVHTTKPKCGLANGSIEIELLSENNAIYEWEGFENTSSTLENIHSGIYFVTVTANDCPITKRVELTEDINNLLTADPLLTNASCNDTGGEINLNISGGTPPYVVTWDDIALNNSLRTDLSSGNYSFIVTDSVGCTISQDIYLNKEELPQLSLKSIGNAACGETNGFIQLDSLSSEYTFKWSHNDILNDPLAENLASGLYSVYAINEIGCSTDTVSYYISSSDTDLRIQEVAVISASCNESADGSIEVNAVNGIAPYQYEWDDEAEQTGNIAQDLSPGTYTVLVTDATNCSRVKSITLGQVNPVYISNISKSAPLCPDSEDGSITVTASGGKGNYSYEWSTGDTTQAVTGLGSGTYSVTVYDNNICSDQADITIAAPDTLSVEYSTEKLTCYSTADGQVELSISGGVPPYAVEWEDGSTLKRRFDLTAGNYNVFISDNNNCSISQNIIVAAKDSVSLDYEITSVSCNGGNDGSIRIDSITNANSPLVEWSNGQIGNTLRNVSAGLYEAVITDSNGCNTAFEFEIDSPDSLQIVNDTITDVLCKDGFNGSINFDVIGGNGNYSFNWDDGPRTSNRSNLTAGIYQVTVTDDLNCTIEKQFTVNEPNPLVLNYTAASISCFGSANGYASIEIEGGISPYQISWADGGVDSVRNDLSAGTHDVLVTDANNCWESIEVIIPNLNPIRINDVIQTIPSCYQGTDGGLELDIIGGNAPYTISWENGETGASLNNISAGNYQVTITDDNNCQLTELITLGDGTPIYLTSVTTANPICYGEPSGMIDVIPDGGNPPFEVVWEDGTRASRREDLLAGTHVFDVVDSTGCSVSYEITIQDPPLEEINNLPSEVFLCTGGVANLDAGDWSSYNWTSDNGFSSNEREISIDAEGNYNLTVTNEAGCEDQHQFSVIKDDNILSADFLLTSEAVVLDTVIIVDVSWRIPDSVRWINPDDPDFYLVSQTDEYQEVIFTRTGEFELSMKANLDLCEADVSKTITVLSREEAARLSEEASKYNSNDLHISTSIYPNPNHGDFRIEMKGNMEYDHNSKIIDVNTGIEYYRFNGKKQMNYIFNVGENRLPDGVYLLVMEAEGETITKRFIVK
ncbi:T9SS type A sorting domain-containing protein [Marivirga sp.]|uniref:T9SS type A sorting domain-containing protein n=1 Tax=Marivirga sp. TaxID=2018662 RepID=UPI0025EE1301|nr:T9SS type A sorting domain-containing protein [Marivirga sp.]